MKTVIASTSKDLVIAWSCVRLHVLQYSRGIEVLAIALCVLYTRHPMKFCFAENQLTYSDAVNLINTTALGFQILHPARYDQIKA